jgi:hypothetical protein
MSAQFVYLQFNVTPKGSLSGGCGSGTIAIELPSKHVTDWKLERATASARAVSLWTVGKAASIVRSKDITGCLLAFPDNVQKRRSCDIRLGQAELWNCVRRSLGLVSSLRTNPDRRLL